MCHITYVQWYYKFMYHDMHCCASTGWTWSITFNFISRIRFLLFPGLLLNKTTAKMCFLELLVIVLTVTFLMSSLAWLWPLPTSKHSHRWCKGMVQSRQSGQRQSVCFYLTQISCTSRLCTFKHLWLSTWNSYKKTFGRVVQRFQSIS